LISFAQYNISDYHPSTIYHNCIMTGRFFIHILNIYNAIFSRPTVNSFFFCFFFVNNFNLIFTCCYFFCLFVFSLIWFSFAIKYLLPLTTYKSYCLTGLIYLFVHFTLLFIIHALWLEVVLVFDNFQPTIICMVCKNF